MERLALETGQSTWDATAAAIANRLIPTRALMALESFRQLILDAQAMMDPDFAGKLAADVAESRADDADTGFGFGAAAADRRPDVADQLGGDETRFRFSTHRTFRPAEPSEPPRPQPRSRS